MPAMGLPAEVVHSFYMRWYDCKSSGGKFKSVAAFLIALQKVWGAVVYNLYSGNQNYQHETIFFINIRYCLCHTADMPRTKVTYA